MISYSRERQYKRIEDRKQFFFDDDVIACVRNVTRTRHAPVKHPANPLIVRDRPWEIVPLFRTPLGKYRMDGHDTNVVFSYPPYFSASCGSVLLDPTDPDPSRRYKSVYIYRSTGANTPKTSPMRGTGAAGLSIAFSPNGIDWTPHAANPIISDWGSDVEILTRDPITHKYVLYGRADHPWNSTHPEFQAWFATVWPDQPTGIWNTRRCVYRLDSDDCLNWSPAELVFAPGKDDNLDDGHYGFTSWRVGDQHLGILGLLHQVDNVFDIELLHSAATTT
jgi:hypothetical protein